jgi:hypothetical protein
MDPCRTHLGKFNDYHLLIQFHETASQETAFPHAGHEKYEN